MVETCGCCPAKADVIVLRVRRANGLFRFAPKPDISLLRLGDAKGHTETSVAAAGSK
jgi:hypothetical protein